ncbi:hypothetical protein Areg01_54660 [Actinoplanes regularis]|nr:AAA family ATPase [Actinoplanes regularis]GLW32528.1 hypothetical protein Areg01_54660 [Actinoplanes regularis]
MAQRAGIAAALLGDPEILLLDEPVNGLDPEGIRWIRGLMRQLAAEGRTVLVSSHLMSEMSQTADHLVVIGQGRLLADSPVDDFVAANTRSYVLVRTPQPDQLSAALRTAGIEVTTLPDGALSVTGGTTVRVGELAASHGLTVHEISSQAASLEEAFMRLTADAVDHRAKTGV